MSDREGRGQSMIFCAALTNHYSLSWSATVQLPYHTVMQYVSRLSAEERWKVSSRLESRLYFLSTLRKCPAAGPS